MKPILKLFLFAIVARYSPILSAQTTITVSGLITSSSHVTVGASYTATLTVDTTVADSDAAGTRGLFNQTVYTTATFSTGGFTWQTNTGSTSTAVVYNNASNFGVPVDGLQILSGGNGSNIQNGVSISQIDLLLASSTNTSLFTDDSANNFLSGASTLPYDNFYKQIRITFPGADTFGSVTSYSASTGAIPEPSTYAAIFGLTAWGVAAYRKRSKTG